jgi:transaldolase
LKIFLDTANVPLIRKYYALGIVDGVTTNPTLLSKEGEDPEEIMAEIVKIVGGPVSLEVIGTTYEEMVSEARQLSKFGKNVVVKIPMIPDGLKVVKSLHSEGIKTNVTLIFSANQALLAAKAGAYFVSPFIGRLDDMGQEGMQVIRECVEIFKNYDYEAEILVGSIRHPLHVIEAAKLGADIATMPPDVLEKMIKHPLTDVGLARFLEDWKKLKRSQKPPITV